ncbi:MAG: hypothetical protein JSS87_03300 [Acidobacteria bacterium]|nr:hypothetical protein [Acidobacteriota bacterium]
MKIGAENRKQLKMLAIFGSLAIVCGIYEVVSTSSNSAPTPSPAPAPVVATRTTTPVRTAGGTAPAAKQVSNAQLDPTLHMEGMLLAEAVEYNGAGRNIFSAESTAPLATIPKPIASARPAHTAAQVQQPVNLGPPPPPPIDLRFFGTATRANGNRQAFFLKGDDVFLASPGDIVSRRYRINSISATSAEVTDLQTNNTQRLPLQMQ